MACRVLLSLADLLCRYARGVTLMGDALGHSWVGLLLARALDPQLQTPVPLAFTYKLLVRRITMTWQRFERRE